MIFRSYVLGGNGGAGVLAHGSTDTANYDLIAGGNGGIAYGLFGTAGNGGNGGNGAMLFNANSVYNYGDITGGIGGEGAGGFGGNGGAGVYIDGGTLVNAGAITGGAGGYGAFGNGAGGDAVLFGTNAGTLVIDPGAEFYGAVVANSAVDDTLVLGGDSVGNFSGVGSQFTGFTTVDVGVYSDWKLNGTNELNNSTTLNPYGKLVVHGGLWDQGTVNLDTGGLMQVNGLLVAHSIDMQGGKLRIGGTGRVVVGSNGSSGAAGEIVINADSNIVGYGVIATPVADEGWITAAGGKLTLKGDVTGGGMIYIKSGATLLAQGSLSVAGIEFVGHDDTLIMGKSTSLDSPIDWFGSSS